MNKVLSLRHHVAGLVLLLAAVPSLALTIGRARGPVLLGQPLELTIPVRLDATEDFDNLCVEADVFHADARVDPARVLVSLERGSGLDATIRLRSLVTVDEPMVTLYIRSGCLQKSTRRYILLADMPTEAPVLAPAGPGVPAGAGAGSRPSPAGAAATAAGATGAQAQVAPPAPVAANGRGPSAAPGATVAPRAEAAPRTGRRASARTVAPDAPVEAEPPLAKAGKSAKGSVARPASPKAAGKSRLKLEPLDLYAERDPVLKASPELLSTPAATDADRAAAAALWRALNAQPQDVLRDEERLKGLESDVRALRDVTSRNQSMLGQLRTELERAQRERYANGLVYALAVLLALALAIAGLLWYRSRQASTVTPDWWRKLDREIVADSSPAALGPAARAVRTSTTAPLAPVPPADDSVETVDFDLDAPSDMLATQKVERASAAFGASSLPPYDRADFSLSLPGMPRAMKAEELFDVQQQADFFVSLGQYDQAIEVLKNHIGESPDTSALAYLDLFRIYHSLNRREEYDVLRTDFNQVFNTQVPKFDAFAEGGSGLEGYQAALSRIIALWPTPRVLDVIEESIFRKPDAQEAFDLEAYRELLLLYGVAKDVVDRPATLDFVASGPDSRPGAGERAAQNQFSMTSLQGLPMSPAQAAPSGFADSGTRQVPDPSALPEVIVPRASKRLGLDIDLDRLGRSRASGPATAAAPSAFLPVGPDSGHIAEAAAPDAAVPMLPDDVPAASDAPAASPQGDDTAPAMVGQPSNLIDFDLFDAAVERQVSRKTGPGLI